jgi:thiamine biosynthesis lipoprotein
MLLILPRQASLIVVKSRKGCYNSALVLIITIQERGDWVSSQKGGTPRYQRLLPLVIIVALAAIFITNRFFFPPPMLFFQDRREMMDTWVTITVYDRNPKVAEAAISTAFARMETFERIASIYDPQAEAFRLNETGRSDDPSPELWKLIEVAQDYYTLTDGTFDITVEPLLDLWRYKEGADQQFWELDPEIQEQAIAAVLALVGANRITLSTDPQCSIVLEPGMKITFGGIAKGYAVDQGLNALRTSGIAHALIDAGGDIGVFGGKPGGAKWELSLRNPKDSEDSLVRFVLTDGAIATSGNYERYFDIEAKVGHIMDPRTGYSSHASSSASVVAGTCMQADALATAMFVLGPQKGIELANSLDRVETLIVSYDEPEQVYRSDGLEEYVEKKGDL